MGSPQVANSASPSPATNGVTLSQSIEKSGAISGSENDRFSSDQHQSADSDTRPSTTRNDSPTSPSPPPSAAISWGRWQNSRPQRLSCGRPQCLKSEKWAPISTMGPTARNRPCSTFGMTDHLSAMVASPETKPQGRCPSPAAHLPQERLQGRTDRGGVAPERRWQRGRCRAR